MKNLLGLFALCLAISSCKLMKKEVDPALVHHKLSGVFENYYEDRLKLFPLEATSIGDPRYNDKFYVDFTDNYRDSLRAFYSRYRDSMIQFREIEMNADDHASLAMFQRDLRIALQGFDFPYQYMPANQFYALPLTFGVLGSGSGDQPFATVQDYDNWLSRAKGFGSWVDSAIVYFKKGVTANVVLPKALVLKMVPEMRSMQTDDPTKSIFYGPINKLPASFNDADKQRLTAAFTSAIKDEIVPAYARLADFYEKEYLPKARTTTGISDIPGGKERYQYLIRYWTTTDKTPDEIYATGLSEVTRIKKEMERVKTETGFNGDLKAFFEYMNKDPKFFPYKTPEEVLNAFKTIQARMEPNLSKMFTNNPKTAFEIRQTEAFRAASASAEYNQGSADGKRPGIFYVPILDATKYNSASGMESLFLHEAIPGHHYQISLQQENDSLPKFRRFAGYGAYQEGWALYCESLGKELGLYTDPYQYMGALGDEMHRAIRLVVDVGMHTKGLTREQAIQYMMENEAISEQGATAEIERYMAIPGQALSYKIGALKIRELRTRYEKELGQKFNLARFHDYLLKQGPMPLDVLETVMNDWAEASKN
jgi:uncharacterized protein (DUF885 family)